MSSYPPPPPPYQPPGVPPPQYPYVPPPPPRRAAGGDVALKILIGSAVGTGVGFGMCGLGAIVGQAAGRSVTQVAVWLGLSLFAISLLGMVVSAIWLLVAAIIGGSRR